MVAPALGVAPLPFRRGMNINGLEGTHYYTTDNSSSWWGGGNDNYGYYLSVDSTYSDIKAKGFDHVRLPVDFRNYYDADTKTLKTSGTYKITDIDTIINKALDAGLYITLDFHGWYIESDVANSDADTEGTDANKLVTIWGLVADRYRNYSDKLNFEILNEPHVAAYNPNSNLDKLQAKVLARIRQTNPTRLVLWAVSDSDQPWLIDNVTLPAGAANVAIVVHCYNPAEFTHMGETWANSEWNHKVSLTDEHRSTLRWNLNKVKSWQDNHPDIPIVMNEFSVCLKYESDAGINADIIEYLSTVRNFCESNRIAWAYWQYCDHGSTDMGARKSYNGQWRDNVSEALFPPGWDDPEPEPVVYGPFDMDAFAKKVDVTFRGYSGTALTDFPVLVKLSTAIRGFRYSDFARTDGGDLRFADANGNLLPHEIDTWNPNGVSTVWVKVPSLFSNATIKACYGCTGESPAVDPKDVWSNGYVGVWHLGESALPMKDSSGASSALTQSSGTLGFAAEGIVGGSVDFGTFNKKNLLSAPDVDALDGVSACTWEAWTYQTNHSVNAGILAKRAGYNNNVSYQIYDAGSSSALARLTMGTNTTSGVSANLDVPLELSQWNHLVYTFNAGSVAGYNNGASKGSRSFAASQILSGTGPFCVGSFDPNDSRNFPGKIDEVRISNVARSAAWVKATHDTVTDANFATYSMLQTNALVVYPEYPAQIERDYAYAVSVTQGSTTTNLVVYNHCEKSSLTTRTRGGDVNRRFCEFAFSGERVRVDIAVCEDVQSYKVFPSRLGLETSFADGVISVWLDEPHSFGIELNDYVKTILSVLVDEPENPANVPSPGDPGVLYVDGWMNPPGIDGVVLVSNNWSEVYIAPGAVLNARLYVHSPDVHVHGRGMILDPFSDIFRFDQLNNTHYGVLWVTANGKRILIEDIKIVDARQYNYWTFAEDTTLRNVKALSTMMCSDGITSGGKHFTVDRAWLYVGDNALVVSGNSAGSTFRDVTIGTSCKAIFPQSNNYNVRMEDIDVFRADEALVWNSYNTKTNELNQSFFFRNISAVDCALFARFFGGGNMGTKPKPFGFENVAIPNSTGTDNWTTIGRSGGKTIRIFDDAGKPWVTGNYTLAITNLWVNGQRSDGFAESEITRPDGVTITVTNTLSEPAIPAVPNRHVVNWTCPYKRYIGDSIQRDIRLATPAAGEQRLVEPNMRANLLVDRPATRSNWQRSPSYQAKLDATTFDPADGARIYRVRNSLANAGMYCNFTDGFLRRGNGTWRLSFDARINVTNGTPPVIQAKLISNEKTRIVSFPLVNNGDWTNCTADITTSFDLSETTLVGLNRVTELVGLQLISTNGAERIEFKNLSFSRIDVQNLPGVTFSGASAAPGYAWTNGVASVTATVADGVEQVPGSKVRLTVADTHGTILGTVDRDWSGSGEYSFDTAESIGGSAYADGFDYTLSFSLVVPGDAGGVFAAKSVATTLRLGSGAPWFSADPATDTVAGGEWETAPSIDSGTYVIANGAAFVADDNRNGYAHVEYVVPREDAASIPESNLPDHLAFAAEHGERAALVSVQDSDGVSWRGLVQENGTLAWKELLGAVGPSAAEGEFLHVAMEVDTSGAEPLVSYLVRWLGPDPSSFMRLHDASGAEWFPAPGNGATLLGHVDFEGDGKVVSLVGQVLDKAVADVGGVRYDTLAEALMGEGDVTLLTNDTWPTDAPVGTMRVDRDGYTLLLPPSGVSIDGDTVVVSAGLSAIAGEGKLRITFGDLAGLGIATAGRTPAQIAADLLATGANGIPKWQSYVLGLDASDPDARPLADIALGDADDSVEVSARGVTVNEAAGATVRYRVYEVRNLSDPEQDVLASESAVSSVELDMDGSGAQFFRIEVRISLL